MGQLLPVTNDRCPAVKYSNATLNFSLDIGLLGHFKRVFDFDSQIPHSAFDLGVPK
jgi:hypothetical protein